MRPTLERLESRDVPAVFLIDGYLAIVGEDLNTHLHLDDVAIVSEFNHDIHDDSMDCSDPTSQVGPCIEVYFNGQNTYWYVADLPRGIIFEGYDGNDSFWNQTGIRSSARGGEDNDLLIGGWGVDLFWGDGGNDNLNGGAGMDVIYGGTGNDIISGGYDDDELHGDEGDDILGGQAGKDRLFGDAGNDHLYGDEGKDRLEGGADNDHLEGGDHDDILLGESGKDTLEGGDGADLLWGGANHDVLRGGGGNDTLRGGDDNDRLYGDDGDDNLYGEYGNDLLEGGNGSDGLVPGYGKDLVRGQGNDDRFLSMHNSSAYGSYNQDFLLDVTNQDAVIHFAIGNQTWTHEELEVFNDALAVLHLHPLTGHTQLLKMPDGGDLTFVRRDAMVPSDFPEEYPPFLTPTNLGAMNFGNGEIEFYDHGMDHDPAQHIAREIGRNWVGAANPFWKEFVGVSQWTESGSQPGDGFVASLGQNKWWFLHEGGIGSDPDFVGSLSTINPYLDFAETFAYFFTVGMTSEFDTIDDKLDLVAQFLGSL